MENITKRLVDEFGIKKELIALRLKASVRSVERWRDGESKPLPGYQERLKKMLEREIQKAGG